MTTCDNNRHYSDKTSPNKNPEDQKNYIQMYFYDFDLFQISHSYNITLKIAMMVMIPVTLHDSIKPGGLVVVDLVGVAKFV